VTGLVGWLVVGRLGLADLVSGSGFRVQGSGVRGQGSGFRVQGLGSDGPACGAAPPTLHTPDDLICKHL